MIAKPVLKRTLKLLVILFLLYGFLLSIKLIGSSFQLFGKDFASQLIDSYSNPVLGLATGILATSLIQSSSTVTSLIVGLAGGGILPIRAAIPLVMGANMGTTITNILVALTFVTRKVDFRRAFAAATVHDFFNILTILLFFPLEIKFHLIEKSAVFLTGVFKGMGGVSFTSPFKLIINPVATGLKHLLTDILSLPDAAAGTIMLVLAVTVVIVTLVYLVRTLRAVTSAQTESSVDKYLFSNAFMAISLGMILTAIVQSSSITTSLIVPLVAAGVISLANAYTFTLGANIGTTVTAMLASLATVSVADGGGVNTVGVTVAFAHLMFNIYGVIIFLPLKRIPIFLATKLANKAADSKKWAFIFVISVFFLLPLLAILLIR
ncbi:MAG: Na/Pi symporter [Dehalococcoidales bacterium]